MENVIVHSDYEKVIAPLYQAYKAEIEFQLAEHGLSLPEEQVQIAASLMMDSDWLNEKINDEMDEAIKRVIGKSLYEFEKEQVEKDGQED